MEKIQRLRHVAFSYDGSSDLKMDYKWFEQVLPDGAAGVTDYGLDRVVVLSLCGLIQ